MASKAHIPRYELTQQSKHAIFIAELSQYDHFKGHTVHEPHTDDHYTLGVIKSGRMELIIDFEQVVIHAPALLLIAPEQVHRLIGMEQCEGWLANIDTTVISSDLQVAVREMAGQPVMLTGHIAELMQIAAQLEIQDTYIEKAIRHIIESVVSIALSLAGVGATTPVNRTTAIFRQFHRLLEEHYAEWKHPADYAGEMAISASHLNDSVKEFSGSPVSVHIQERNILEAKRLLYNTGLTASEIGFQLGYEDPVYFGKLFKKHTLLTPLAFRAKFRD